MARKIKSHKNIVTKLKKGITIISELQKIGLAKNDIFERVIINN